MQRQFTSVFSEYETMENNSVNSKQLEYWLKQISSPVPSPNLGFEWTFMSNHSSQMDKNSSHPPNNPSEQPLDTISFGKSPYSSIDRDKENNSSLFNANHRNGTQVKSKSYVNAMIALQKKVKTLEDENSFMRKNITKINQERAQSMTQSSVTQEQLKSRLKVIEPKVAKIDELIQSNKILREAKQERTRKIKMLQKNNSELKAQNQELTKLLQEIRKQGNGYKLDAQSGRKRMSQLEGELKKLLEKNKMLEDMKQKSTVTLLQKYNKSIELTQLLQKQNLKLKNQMNYMKSRHAEEIKTIQETQSNEIKKYFVEFEKLKESINLKNSLIEEKKKEADYFRDAYEKKGQQFMELLRSHHKIMESEKSQIKQMEVEKSKILKLQAKLKQKSNQKQLKQKQTQRIQQNKVVIIENVNPASQESSVIRMPQTLIPAQSPPVKRSFDGFDSEEEDQLEESAIPVPIQTKSVGKPVKRKKGDRKGVLSSESRREDSKKKIQQSSARNKNVASPRQHKKILKRKRNSEKEDGSFTMKSCQAPKTQPMHRITFEQDMRSNECEDQERIANSYYYTPQYPPPLPHLSHRNGYEIQDFQKNNNSCQSIDMVMLVELEKQMITLYDQQENLVKAWNDQNATQAERSQFVGRMKQLNEHLRIKNQKLCQLKQKL